MKVIRLLILSAVLSALVLPVRAGNSDLVVNTIAKKTDEKSDAPYKGEGSISEKSEQWIYAVSVENLTFKPLAGLEAKYLIFYKQEQIGSKGPARLQHKSGSFKLPDIDAHGKGSFTTDTVDLKKALLNGNYHFVNGAKAKAEDGLSGIWIRFYLNGALFAEYTRPSTLSSKEKWE